jgi:hypothetical protein
MSEQSRYGFGGDYAHRFKTADTNNLLIFKQKSITINKPAGTNIVTTTIDHGLGYVPSVIAYGLSLIHI